ncbi:acylneuraminate cytidylyltransferase family protein [bacterium]|nr:acylneuraminate cytidylyltransferase family protein [bacterium]
MLAIIPARSGSKRVPGKNIRELGGRPLIAYTIAAAEKAGLVERVIVSTDSERIAALARDLGAEAPFIRPAELAGDGVPDRPVLAHVLDWLDHQGERAPEGIVLLRPTTPFKTGAIIDAAIRLFRETGADAVRTVTRAEGVHHPYWMFRRGEESRALPLIEGISTDDYFQRQLLPPVYHLNGVTDVIRTAVIRSGGPLYGRDLRMLEVAPLNAVDIDTELDLQLCELILQRKLLTI